MKGTNLSLLIGIIILALLAVWIDLPTNPGIHISLGPIRIDREIKVYQGLDLQGGMQVFLEADVPEDTEIDREEILAAKGIIEKRVSSLGLVEPLIQLQGARGILVELPRVEDPKLAIELLHETGLLEFIEAGNIHLPAGMIVKTALEEEGVPSTITPTVESTPIAMATETPTPTQTATTIAPVITPPEATTVGLTPTATFTVTPSVTPVETITMAQTPTPSITPTAVITPTTPRERVFRTVMTSRHLEETRIGLNEYGRLDILFTFTEEADKILADFTSRNVNKYLAIAMDKEIISCPSISAPIPEGGGAQISTEKLFTPAEARKISIQLKYGALPVPFKVAEERAVGPTFGQDSMRKSARAGIIGFMVILLFMLSCYRLPGLVADLALCIYVALVFALCKLIPITLTLSSLAGLFLPVGMALNANTLIFERMREELRVGITPGRAVEVGFRRAWTSIRDSNIAMLIICVILFWFSSHSGASMVKSFALALAIGVAINMFTAITVTRTFLRFLFALAGPMLQRSKWLLGI